MPKKVIVIGLDGLEPSIVERLLSQNELPNLQRIRTSGHYGRVRTTYPAQTPVAWSSFVTGTNPGGHGIFDFISRDPNTYMPDIALNRFERPEECTGAAQGCKSTARRARLAASQHGGGSERRAAVPRHFPR